MGGEATYTAGNCTWYVAHRLSWVKGGWGNAYQWTAAARRAHLSTSRYPVDGSIVVYGHGDGYSSLGHVAIVERVHSSETFDVAEMNYTGLGLVDRRTSNMHGVDAFILPPGVVAGTDQPAPPATGLPALHELALAWSSLVQFVTHEIAGGWGQIGRDAAKLAGLH